MSDLIRAIREYPKVVGYLDQNQKEAKRIPKLVHEIAADFSHTTVKSFKAFLENTFLRLYDGVDFHLPEGFSLEKLLEKSHVILVPNHQSHADYLALTYAFYSRFERPLYIAGGINLNLFGVGKLFRKSGCFFIRRSFHDDPLYKNVLEAYLAYLLEQGEAIKFFFEGGRSRSGKLLPPRYGLFNMLLEAHKTINSSKELLFLPVSIVHEYVPEQSSHAKETYGAKKKEENVSQLLKLYKVVNQRFGTVHLHVGDPIKVRAFPDQRSTVQNLAFRCFLGVGKKMLVTPSSLLALIMLDYTEGVLTWEIIVKRAKVILEYCNQFGVPLSPSLSAARWQVSIERALKIMASNRQISIKENKKLGETFYSANNDARVPLLYFKNTILHHFLVPYLINGVWIKVFNGSIKNVTDLKDFFLAQRKQLKYEFYLPTVKELSVLALSVVSYYTQKNIKSLEDCFNLEAKDLYQLASHLGVFSRAFSYIIEGYYISLMALKYLHDVKFTKEMFSKVTNEIFLMEKEHGRLIKYPESYSVQTMQNSLLYFENLEIVKREEDHYSVVSKELVEKEIEDYVRKLSELLTFNFKLYE